MKKRLFIALLALSPFLLNAQGSDVPDALMLRNPDVSTDEIAFVYAEDVWVVAKDGGLARRITSTTGMERFPKFSPDGKSIAFSGNYDGNTDVYSISNQGSNLKRLTFHPDGELVVDWKPDGSQVLFSSRRKSASGRYSQFYTININGGLAKQLPLQYAEFGSYNSDGSKLAYQYLSRVFRTWKRYQGGTASDLWIYDFDAKKSEKITEYEGSDALPMWNGNSIYFLSDRGAKHKMNIWAYNTSDKSFTQITFFEEYDVKFPSMGPEDIVFENGGALYLYNYASKESRKVNISVPSEHINLRPQLKDLSKNINSFWISPNGSRAMFDARGDIVTVPAEHGITHNLTRTDGIAEHNPDWSPNGKWIAYFSDKDGEYNLYTRNADGSGEETKLTNFTREYHSGTMWSPDSKKIAFVDQLGNLFYIDVASKKITKIVKSDASQIRDYDWSPESDWIVYSLGSPTSIFHSEIHAYELASKKNIRLTQGFYSAQEPEFSADGKYLFYSANRSFTPVYSDVDPTWVYSNSTVLMCAPLAKGTPSIIAPRNDVEEVTEEATDEGEDDKKDKKKDKKKDEGDSKEESKGIVIDADGFEARADELPIPAGNYRALYGLDGKLVYATSSLTPAGGGMPNMSINYYDVEERKSKTIIDGVGSFEMAANGEKMIYSNMNGGYGIISVSPGNNIGDGSIDISKMQAYIHPMNEWTQIYNEAWRLERDFFYDANMHGVDWKALGERYKKLLPYCSSRSDLTYIIGELIGEINVGHAYVGGGDTERAERIGVGLLGVDFTFENNAYRIAKILRGADYDTDVRSPLDDPGVDVSEGDYILAVNGVPVDPTLSPYAAFQGLSNELVLLTVNSKASMDGAREVLVKTMGSESTLRNRAWIEENRQKVLAATDGKCGYIYVPNTGIQGQNELVRQFYGQVGMDALIIDERFNSGGQIPDRFIELLNRPNYNYWGTRSFKSWPTPFVANNGPRVMIANEWAGSGGDAFPYYFKAAKIGPVVGKRTWGGLVGISGLPPLLDGGFLSSPNFGLYNNEGEWDVEGYGVDPDYEVENPSDAVYRGEDAQLNKAIELINEGLAKMPEKVEKPAYPNKTGIGNK